MKKNSPDIPVTLLAAAVVVAFFLPFLDAGGIATASGWDIITAKYIDWTTRVALGALPVIGIVLAGFGATGHRHARPLAFLFGVAVFGYLAYKLVRIFFAASGVGLWLTLAAAAAGLVLALKNSKAQGKATKP